MRIVGIPCSWEGPGWLIENSAKKKMMVLRIKTESWLKSVSKLMPDWESWWDGSLFFLLCRLAKVSVAAGMSCYQSIRPVVFQNHWTDGGCRERVVLNL